MKISPGVSTIRWKSAAASVPDRRESQTLALRPAAVRIADCDSPHSCHWSTIEPPLASALTVPGTLSCCDAADFHQSFTSDRNQEMRGSTGETDQRCERSQCCSSAPHRGDRNQGVIETPRSAPVQDFGTPPADRIFFSRHRVRDVPLRARHLDHPRQRFQRRRGSFELLEHRRLLKAPSLEAFCTFDSAEVTDSSDLHGMLSAEGSPALIQAAANAPNSTGLQALDPLIVEGNTGEKPQSKVWTHAGQWWMVMANPSGTWVWRLDGEAWTAVLQLSTARFRADVLPTGDVVHILLAKDTASKLASIEYVAGSPGTYQAWTSRPSLSNVPLDADAETATLALDTAGRMWVASDGHADIQVRYSDAPYATWSGPTAIATGVAADDISAITSLGGRVGVMWSNQNSQRFGFRTHIDGSAPSAWSADEVPASASAQAIGLGMADDHLSVAVAADGTLYAAVKTSYETPGSPKIALLVRQPSGAWDPLHPVDGNGTRPIVILNEGQDRVMVAYRDTDNNGPIQYRESARSTIAFSAEGTLIADPAGNNVSSTKQRISGEVLVIASANDVLSSSRLVRAPMVLGDLDGDDRLDNFDIAPFEKALASADAYMASFPALADYDARGDADGNERFDNFDIAAFETLLTSGPLPILFRQSSASQGALWSNLGTSDFAKHTDSDKHGDFAWLLLGRASGSPAPSNGMFNQTHLEISDLQQEAEFETEQVEAADLAGSRLEYAQPETRRKSVVADASDGSRRANSAYREPDDQVLRALIAIDWQWPFIS